MKSKLMLILGLVLVLSITACSNEDPDDVEVSPPVEDTETPADDADIPDMEDEDAETGDTEKDLEDIDKEKDDDTKKPKEVSDKWPEDFMPQAPKLAGDIGIAKKEGPNKYFLEFNNITHDEASNYVEDIKEAGFTENTNEKINSNIVKYKGMDGENNLIVFIWKEEISKLELIKTNK